MRLPRVMMPSMKTIWHILRTLPPIPSLILCYRRMRGTPRVKRVLVSRRAVERYYQTTSVQPLPSVHLTRLPRGRVLAQPIAILGPGDALLWGFSPQLQRRPATSSTFWKTPTPARFLSGKALFAAVDGFSYYHWLFGTLPKLILASKLANPDHFIVNPRHKGRVNFQTESLALLGISLEHIIWLDRGTHIECEELLLPSEPCTHHQTQLMPWARDLLVQQFLPLTNQIELQETPQKIYITRSQAKRRRLTNEAEVCRTLEKLGYTAVILESMPFMHQIKYLSSARSVIGLHGAGLANIVFCRPGTQVIEITSSFWSNPCFKHLARQCQLKYTPVRGKGVLGERRGFAADVTVDLTELIAATSTIDQ